MSHLYYGVAYYDEYMPYDRLQKDIEMMLEAGINVVRIAESTWSTLEPSEGVYNFHHIDRVLDAMHSAGIDVIIGTPTYAIPAWLAKKHPDVMVTTKDGTQKYGPRQIMDIVNPTFRRYADNIIRVLMNHVCNHPAIIGYQLDNETKHYDNFGHYMQTGFVTQLREKYSNLENLNADFGLNYWSNRIDDWEDFPLIDNTINASLACAFATYQRQQVTDYLAWQADIVNEFRKPDQFVTHNFDFEWRGYSYGVQPSVDHFAAAKSLTVAGVDIYHPGQDHLTGREIAFGGAITRSLKQGQNYYVLETQAQGFAQWTPYPRQLRLQAFSHVAHGASMVSYWHWHSIHNSFETYWKGLLSHDFLSNPTYEEACTVGRDFALVSKQVIDRTQRNDVAILVNNEAMDALNHFKPGATGPSASNLYNDIFRRFHDALYDNNISVDIINTVDPQCDKYKIIVIPSLYSASDKLLEQINAYVERGGKAMISFKSGFSDENVKVRHSSQPGLLSHSCGVSYNQFVLPDNLAVTSTLDYMETSLADIWAELLTPESGTDVIARYDHPFWNQYAAVTQSDYGRGKAMYIGFLPTKEWIVQLFNHLTDGINLISRTSDKAFPVIIRELTNKNDDKDIVRFIFNYSSEPVTTDIQQSGTSLLTGEDVKQNDTLTVEAWGVVIIKQSH